MKTSIIVSTYGEESWAELAMTRAVPSAQAQDPFEVVVGHDPDATIAQVRNALAEKARGDWLCFLDADDELAEGYLSIMQRAYEQESHRAGPLLLTPAVSYVLKGKRRPPRFWPGENLRDDNYLVVGTLVERDLFMEVGGFEDYPHGFEDFSLWSKCWRLGAEVVKVPRAIYVAHVNPNSKHRTGWRDRKWQVETHLRVVRELDEWHEERMNA